MITAIVGSRRGPKYEDIEAAIKLWKEITTYEITKVVSGGAIGADTLGAFWADINKVPKLILLPNWNLGSAAGFLRNVEVVTEAEGLIAIWNGKSNGTKHTIELAKAKGIPTLVCMLNSGERRIYNFPTIGFNC